jgi:ATP-dependent Clp protease ATP-binding subunit ClpA
MELHPFLKNKADGSLVNVLLQAINEARANGRDTYLSDVIYYLLDENSVRARVPREIRVKCRADLTKQQDGSSSGSQAAGGFAFDLELLTDPAIRLSDDCGADRVTPIIFLATCLSPKLFSDLTSLRAQEVTLRAGLRVETLLPHGNGNGAQADRLDFTYQSLGYGTDLTAMARAGSWETCPAIGVEDQIDQLAELISFSSGSVVLLGEPGVGKSALVYGLAYYIGQGSLIGLEDFTIISIRPTDIVAGSGVRGSMEDRLNGMVRFFHQNPNVIPFFDEIHALFDPDDSSAKTISNTLKPPMASGAFSCIGASTDQEYARFIAIDKPLDDRFTKILIQEPDNQTTIKIINASQDNIIPRQVRQLNVTVSADAIGRAVEITSRYQRTDRQPRKTIRLLKRTVAAAARQVIVSKQPSIEISAQDVAEKFSKLSGIPLDHLDDKREAYYQRLEQSLKTSVLGQDKAIEAVTLWLSMQARGWVNPKRPRGRFLFLGPPGVGKTELALQLAEQVMRDRGSLVVKNMGEFKGEGARSKWMGADPGYIGYGQTATVYNRVLMRPFSVVVLDEIEKANPELSDVLLSALDGFAEDSQGRWVDFSQCIFILTSNSLAHLAGESHSKAQLIELLGVLGDENPGDLDELSEEELRQRFSELTAANEGHLGEGQLRQLLLRRGGIWQPPLLDRIDRIALFRPLNAMALLQILDQMIAARQRESSRELPAALKEEGARREILGEAINMTGGAFSARALERALLDWLIKSPEN